METRFNWKKYVTLARILLDFLIILIYNIMSNISLKAGNKYHVKGFSKPVTLKSWRTSTGLATVTDGNTDTSIDLKDILSPVIDSILAAFGKWLLSLFKK